jgi:protein TonB
MSDMVSVRATSVLASAGALGALAALALSASFTHIVLNRPDAPPDPIVSVVEDLPAQDREPNEALPPEGPPLLSAGADALPIAALASPQESASALASFTPTPGPRDIADPRWLRRPSNLDAYYPTRARERGREGQVVLDCLVGTDGGLTCAVISESPANWGFADAALAIARDHRMAPALQDGAPVIGRYRMVVPFRMD